MSKQSFWRAYRHLFLLGMLLILFILGFYGLGSIYTLSNTKSKTVVLSSEQFNSSLTNLKSTAFELKATTKLTNDFLIYGLQIIDHNSVVLQVSNNAYSSLKNSVLQLDDNQLKDIAKNVEYGISLTPNAKKLVYLKSENVHKVFKTYVYDLQSNKQLNEMEGNSYNNAFINNEQYLGNSGNELILANVTTGEIKTLLSYDRLVQLILAVTGSKDDGEVYILDLKVVENQKKGYILAYYGGVTGIFLINLEDTSKMNLLTQGEAIQQFAVLKNGDLLLLGGIGGEEGIFLYQRAAHKLELLQEGLISNFGVDAEEKRIAYFIINKNQTGDLHTAYLENGSLNSDTVIYRNIDSLQSMGWYQDDLFVSSNQSDSDKSEIYRFSFKEW